MIIIILNMLFVIDQTVYHFFFLNVALLQAATTKMLHTQ